VKKTTRPKTISRSRDARTVLLQGARRRAKLKGLPFDLTAADIHIPELCPALGLRLERNVGGKAQGKRSPTLDRISGRRGYVCGNVIVLSCKANQIKSTATPDELERVAAFVRQLVE
jgi:hypothetical protein